MIIDSLFPVLFIVISGVILKKKEILNDAFFKCSDQLVYFVLFPLMLFWKIGSAPIESGTGWNYLLASGCAVFVIFLLSLLVIRFTEITAFQAGSFSQSCYRFNTYIGMAVVINLFGEKGVQLFGILIGFLIPFINVLCVAVLIWFSGDEGSFSRKMMTTIKSLVVNPLIIGCTAGLGYGWFVGGFPSYIDNTLRLLSSTTLPLALLSIGGSLSFASLYHNSAVALKGAFIKLLLLPAVGLIFLYLFNVSGLEWKVSLVFFSLPTSTAIYVLSSQLNSDTNLASAAIVASTCGALISISAAIYIIGMV